MPGMAVIFPFLLLPVPPIELEADVYEVSARHFKTPIWIDKERQKEVDKVHVFVSEDRGKTWKHLDLHKPDDDFFDFNAPADGLYWFSLQAALKDGRLLPRDTTSLQPMRKVFVNSARNAVRRKRSYDELQDEVEKLGKTVRQLQRRIKELESAGEGKGAAPTPAHKPETRKLTSGSS